MPVCYKLENDSFSLGLWELSEDEAKLSTEFSKIAPKNEIVKAGAFKYPARKSEWIATRLLLYDLLNCIISIDYDEHGKPILGNYNKSISISHTKGMVAVIVARNITGIDIELVNDRVLSIEKKFMSGMERGQVSQLNKAHNLLVYWTAKETLYKVNGRQGLDFKKNLYLNPFKLGSKGEIVGEVITSNRSTSYCLNYFHHTSRLMDKNYMIVYYYN